MGILDWLKNRPSQFDPDRLSDEMSLRAIEKAVSLTNPSLKLLPDYQTRLARGAGISVRYIRDLVLSLPGHQSVGLFGRQILPARFLCVCRRHSGDTGPLEQPAHPVRDRFRASMIYFILVMKYSEQRAFGLALQGDVVQRDVAQTVVGFSDHQVRICGHEDKEIRRRSARRPMNTWSPRRCPRSARIARSAANWPMSVVRSVPDCVCWHNRDRGWDHGSAPYRGSFPAANAEAQLLENERQMEALGSPQSALSDGLDTLWCRAGAPGELLARRATRACGLVRSIHLWILTMAEQVSPVEFSLARLTGVPQIERAFVMARFARSEMPSVRMDFGEGCFSSVGHSDPSETVLVRRFADDSGALTTSASSDQKHWTSATSGSAAASAKHK